MKPILIALLLTLLFTFFFATPAIAEEGFRNSSLGAPGPVVWGWDATFALFTKTNFESGSAALIDFQKTVPYGTYYLYFLTSAHVLPQSCLRDQAPCSELFLTTSQAFDYVKNNFVSIDSNNRTFNDVYVEKISVANDLALLKAKVDSNTFFGNRKLKLPGDCSSMKVGDEVWLFGYPGPRVRPDAKGFTDQNRFLKVKRMSHGIITNLSIDTLRANGTQTTLVGSTADAISGNSGGALVNSLGELIGTLESAGSRNTPGIYIGSETASPKVPHAFTQKCQVIKSFLK